MADWLQFTVRFLHIFFGVTWVGGAVFYGHSVVGGLMRATPQVRAQAMLGIVGKMMTLFMIVGPLTILFGLWNQYLIYGSDMFQGVNASAKTMLGVSFVLSIATLLVGILWNRPAFNKLKAIAAGPQPPPAPVAAEAARMGKRMMVGGITMTVLLVVALGLMVAATLARVGGM